MYRYAASLRKQIVGSLRTITCTAAIAVGLGNVAPARADLLFGITTDVAQTGSSSNELEVTLTNTGTTISDDALIAGFSFEITAAGTDVTFASTTTDTTTFNYIFAGNSLYGPNITLAVSPDGHTISASDNYATPNSDITLAHGQTLGLGLVNFSLSPSTPVSPIGISFSAFPATGVNSSVGSQYDFVVSGNTSIDVTPGVSSVPEPSTIASFGIGILGMILAMKRRQSTVA